MGMGLGLVGGLAEKGLGALGDLGMGNSNAASMTAAQGGLTSLAGGFSIEKMLEGLTGGLQGFESMLKGGTSALDGATDIGGALSSGDPSQMIKSLMTQGGGVVGNLFKASPDAAKAVEGAGKSGMSQQEISSLAKDITARISQMGKM